jgi:hypothetical protein
MPDRRPFAFDVESDDGGNSVVEDGDGTGHLEDEDSTSMGSDDNDNDNDEDGLPMENQTHDEMSQGLVPFGIGESDLSDDDDDDASADEDDNDDDDDDEYDVSDLYDGSFAPVQARPESRREAAPARSASDTLVLETLVVAAIRRGIELVHGQATGCVYKNAQQLIKEYGYP